MRRTSLGNSYVSESAKKTKNKKNAKSSSTDVDSNSQKHDSSSNQKKISHLNLSIKTQKSHKMIRQNTPQKKKHLYLPINELKQFKTWNCSNLNAIYQNILANEKVNYLYIKPIFGNHFDINDIHRTILVDWLINVHLYFKLSDECLYLSIKLIDSFLARTTNFTKNKLQLLGICSLQISSKYIEQVHPSINDLSDLCDKCYEKKDIVEFEKHLLQVNDYIIEQDQILNYYDLLCLILRFNIKYYFNYKMIINMTDSLDTFINTSGEKSYKLYSFRFPDTPYVNNEVNMDINPINIINYLFSFYPYKDKKPVFECCKDIINLFEKMRTSKYNSAIQKYFIQIKEIKEDVTIESTNENYENSNSPSLFSNFIENQNQVSEDKLDDDIEMIMVD